jgi:integrase
VSEFATRYLRPTRKDPKQAEDVLKHHVLSEWHGRDARSIQPSEVVDLMDRVVESWPVIANTVAALLEQIFKFGIQRHIVPATPVQLLYPPGGREKPRKRTLSEEELSILPKNIDLLAGQSRFGHVAMRLLLTGQRRGELSKARWRNVSFTANTWAIPGPDAKNDDPTLVPLSDWALREFEGLRKFARGSQWSLPAKDGDGHVEDTS